MAVTLKSYALWNLTAVKRYLRGLDDTGQDDFLNGVINAVTDRFELFTGRHLGWHDFTAAGELYDGPGTTVLYLLGYPIRTLDSVAIEDESAIDTTNNDVIRFRKNDLHDSGALRLVNGRLWSRDRAKPGNVTVKYICGFAPVVDAGTSNSLPEELHHAGLQEIARRFYERDRVRDGVVSTSFEGASTVYERPGRLLADTEAILESYQGWPV